MTDLTQIADTTREETAWRAVGAASARIRQIGDTLVAAFDEFERRRDALTDERFGGGNPQWSKPVESAYATWKNDRHAETAVLPAADGELGWPTRSEAEAA